MTKLFISAIDIDLFLVLFSHSYLDPYYSDDFNVLYNRYCLVIFNGSIMRNIDLR